MKKFILLAALGIAAASYQPANAQVSISVNFGTPNYYGYNTHYVPQPIYLERTVKHHRNQNYHQKRDVLIYKPKHYTQQRTYNNNYRPKMKYYSVKNIDNKHYNKSLKRSRGKGRH